MRFVKIKNKSDAVIFVADRLNKRLSAGARVLWLVPGGSAMDIAVSVTGQLDKHSVASRLAISLTDERFGLPGHPDSNWTQLFKKGFRPAGARLLPVLKGQSLKKEAESYGSMLVSELLAAEYSVALGGMGADGHIFGIKPGSPAVNSRDMVCGYGWQDYQRLTPTPVFWEKVDDVIMYVVGEEKHAQLKSLESDIDPTIQPAQLLKKFKNVTILNDWKGE